MKFRVTGKLVKPSQSIPPLSQRVASFARAVKDEALSVARGVPRVQPEEEARRSAICDGCEWLTKDKRCAKCGCWRNLKVAWRSQRCPVGKW